MVRPDVGWLPELEPGYLDHERESAICLPRCRVERQLTLDEKREIVLSLLEENEDLTSEQIQVLACHLGEPIGRIVKWKSDGLVKNGAMAKKVRQLKSAMRNGASIRQAARIGWHG